MNITQHLSPNKSKRKVSKIDMIVIHATAGSFDSALNWMLNPKAEASAHYLISKTGAIVQLVKDEDKAWHAGVSEWHGEHDCNQFSIGIELENLNDNKDPYPEAQIKNLVLLVHELMKKFPHITKDRIVGHNQIAPGRKTDPGIKFPWVLFGSLLREEID